MGIASKDWYADHAVFGSAGISNIGVRSDWSSISSIWDHAQFEPTRQIVEPPSSSWRSKLEEKLNELTSLSVGWDGYQGLPVSFTCADFAVRVLDALCIDDVPAPSLIPGTDGTLQIEWHCCGFDIELDVLDAGSIEAYRHNIDTGHEESIEVGVDFSEISGWIEEMVETA